MSPLATIPEPQADAGARFVVLKPAEVLAVMAAFIAVLPLNLITGMGDDSGVALRVIVVVAVTAALLGAILVRGRLREKRLETISDRAQRSLKAAEKAIATAERVEKSVRAGSR